SFGPGANNAYVTQLGRMLVDRGGKRFYTEGPGPRWGEADRRATQAFQRAQGWTGAAADGIPGPQTWSYLVSGKGKDIPAAGAGGAAPAGAPAKTPAAAPAGAPAKTPAVSTVPAYPGLAAFRPGASGDAVTRLGRRLVEKGFGASYTQGPGPRWGEADRRA
ncbi:hypothetical protein GTW43_30310, partial [Streptomyces sp. SID5785]|uniref:peptidoglycan-binding protein n=1 Tax=Streptomyces sp. SID5785 TaxID=2690309 RepID=UPI001361517A